MKKPRISKLCENISQTAKIRAMATETSKIKVTFYLDADLLEKLKTIAGDTGAKYQTLLNRFLRDALTIQSTVEDRVQRLEMEVKKLKNKHGNAA